METVLIIGGAGFIGSNLADELLRTGKYKVITVDDLSGTSNLLNLEFAKSHNNKRHTFYLNDVADPAFSKILKLENPSIIINCCTTNVYPHLVLSQLNKDIKYYFLRNIYQETRFFGKGENSTCIGVCNVFGGRQKSGLVPEVFTALKEENKVAIKKDEVCEWMYVSDLISAIKLILTNDVGEDIIVSSGEIRSYSDIYDAMKSIYKGKKPENIDVYSNPLDTRDIKALGWKPKRTLNEWLEHTMSWYELNAWVFRDE